MRKAWWFPMVMMLTGCLVSPSQPPAQPRVAVAVAPGQPAPALRPAETPATPPEAPVVVRRELGGIVFEGVTFDARSHRLAVAEQPAGPGSRWADAAAVLAAWPGLAVLNAGFFTPAGEPLGRVVAGGTGTGTWNRSSSLGSAVWLEDDAGQLRIERREAVIGRPAVRELLQAGPLLVERGKSVDGLNAEKSGVRSILAWDGGSRWWLGRSSACSLADLGRTVAAGEPGGWPVAWALNLDGGRSSDFAVAAAVPGGPLVRRALWNRPVRNFLVLAPR